MSNTGKSTLGKALFQRLNHLNVELIDADDYRKTLNADLGFSKEDRIENIRRLQKIANDSKADIVILCAVTPYEEMRSKDNINIFLTSPLEILISRDVEKQVYKNTNVAGIDFLFESPQTTPHLQINTSSHNINTHIDLILDYADIKPKYAMFIGRWQTLHEGHDWLFNQRLNLGENILICIRDVPKGPKDLLSANEVQINLQLRYADLISKGRIKLLIIPDITSVNYGRDVGYEVKEFIPPEEISNLSGTMLRQ